LLNRDEGMSLGPTSADDSPFSRGDAGSGRQAIPECGADRVVLREGLGDIGVAFRKSPMFRPVFPVSEAA
jgi:hypothetical protein